MNATHNMVQLLDLLRREIGPCPPGPERERRKRAVAEKHLAQATTEAERLFWSTFRDHATSKDESLCIRCGKVKPPEVATAHDDLKPYCGIPCAMLDDQEAHPPEPPPTRGPILLGPIPPLFCELCSQGVQGGGHACQGGEQHLAQCSVCHANHEPHCPPKAEPTYHCRKCGASSLNEPEDGDCNPMSIGPQDHAWLPDDPSP